MSPHNEQHDEYADEPIRGLPAHLPVGEKILWQGTPNWRGLARHGYHLTSVAVYFGLLLIWRLVVAVQGGESLPTAVLGVTWLITLAAAALAVLTLLAWLSARSTVYTITNHRVVMRFGVALPMTVNIPFKVIDAAALKTYADGNGEIAMTLTRAQRVAYMVTWPHVRPWRITRPQPSLRVLPNASRVSELLSAALQGLPVTSIAEVPVTEPRKMQGLGVPVSHGSVAA